MTVASLDLCRELYELSGWRNDSDYWFEGIHQRINFGTDKGLGEDHWPAYDLGYLLRKLPIELPKGSGNLQLVHDDERQKDTKGWVCGYLTYDYESPHYELAAESGAPEDAAAKLAIELFKSGVLTR